MLTENTVVKAGEWFSASDLQRTYNNFARLSAVRYTNITFREDTLHNLDTDIRLSMRKPNTIAFQPEGTNTAGDFGAAATLTYQNRNLFRGSELLSIELRGAFEAIKGLEGYERGDYEEYGVEARFQMPRLMTPFLSRKGRRGSTASTELSVAWNLQNRPEFHRRVFSAGLKYRWPTRDGRVQYKLDVLDLSYVYMPWISATFKHDYLDSVSNRNAILRYNYEDLFIMKAGFGLTYNAGDRVIRASVETAGNLLSGFSQIFRFKQNSHGQRQLFNIAYAQYAKFDFEYTRLLRFSSHNTLALHGLLGVAWPYGNSTVLPFEKRYFSGGANSVRGWSVRELGPRQVSWPRRPHRLHQSDRRHAPRPQPRVSHPPVLEVRRCRLCRCGQHLDAPILSRAARWPVSARHLLQADRRLLRPRPAPQLRLFHPPPRRCHEGDQSRLRRPQGPLSRLPSPLGRDFAFHFAVGMPF